jgi:hypothetical protein
MISRIAAVAVCALSLANAFAPNTARSPLKANYMIPTPLFSTLNALSAPKLFKQLPWNAQKERARLARKLKLERSDLHRQVGVAEGASYEEIVEVTNELIARAGSDVKAKIKIEIAKDKILQLRLNERLAGLARVESDARAQSKLEGNRYVVCIVLSFC